LCFDLAGKDFVLFVKEIQTGDETYPDYKMSMFKQDTTSLPVFIKEKEFSKTHQLLMVKLIQHKVKLKLSLDREHQLEEFEPKKLTEEQQTKITDITNYLTGKSSNSFAESKPASEVSSKTTSRINYTSTSTAASNGSEDEEDSSLTFNSQVVNS
jgi:hypothetical protein